MISAGAQDVLSPSPRSPVRDGHIMPIVNEVGQISVFTRPVSYATSSLPTSRALVLPRDRRRQQLRVRLAAYDSFGRQAEAIAIKSDRLLKVSDAERQDGNARFHGCRCARGSRQPISDYNNEQDNDARDPRCCASIDRQFYGQQDHCRAGQANVSTCCIPSVWSNALCCP